MLFYRKEDNIKNIIADFNVFTARFRSDIYHTNGNVKCISCDGSGRIYDPNDPRCPIEGNKMRNVIGCPHCKKTGVGRLQDWKNYWRKDKKEFTARWKKEAINKAKHNRILKKLTKSERDFLGLGRYEP